MCVCVCGTEARGHSSLINQGLALVVAVVPCALHFHTAMEPESFEMVRTG